MKDITFTPPIMVLNILYVMVMFFGYSDGALQVSGTDLTYEKLTDPLTTKLNENCKTHKSEIRFLPSGFVVPESYLDIAQKIRDMDVRSDDVWLITYPKSGTTWTQEMLWLLLNNLDFEEAKSKILDKRSIYLELSGILSKDFHDPGDTVADIGKAPSPRLIKTHVPPSLLPKKYFEVNPKTVYVYRNPKDVAVSYYHQYRTGQNYKGTKEDFFEVFLQDKVLFGSYWEHILEYWKFRNNANFLMLTYEEMKEDHSKVLGRTAEFLGVSEIFCNEGDKKQLLQHLSFKSMQKNDMVNHAEEFRRDGITTENWMRKGKVGGWTDEMSKEMSTRFDDWTRGKLEGSDFVYKYYNEDYEARVKSQNEGAK